MAEVEFDLRDLRGIVQIYRDGDSWCALSGRDLQEGFAGFGDTPLEAVRALCDEVEKVRGD